MTNSIAYITKTANILIITAGVCYCFKLYIESPYSCKAYAKCNLDQKAIELNLDKTA